MIFLALDIQLIIVPVAVAAIAAAGAFYAAQRRMSGKIGSSEAQSLWQESASIREDYRMRAAAAELRILSLEGRLVAMEKDHAATLRDNLELMQKVIQLELQVHDLQARLDRSEAENRFLRKRIQTLEANGAG